MPQITSFKRIYIKVGFKQLQQSTKAWERFSRMQALNLLSGGAECQDTYAWSVLDRYAIPFLKLPWPLAMKHVQ